MIAICDDNQVVVESLKAKVTFYLKKQGCMEQVVGYTSGRKLLEDVQEIDCAYLDIDMPEINGYDLAKRIREIKPHCTIIMATGTNDYKEGFRIRIDRFVTKPFQDAEVEDSVAAYIDRCCTNVSTKAYHNRKSFDVLAGEIMYVRSIGGEVEIITREVRYRKDSSLSDLEEELPYQLFFRCHKQYLVNLKYIKIVNSHAEINGIKIPVSRRKKAEFERKLIEYRSTFV